MQHPTPPQGGPAPRVRPPLLRHHGDHPVAGVCAGLARHLELPVAWVRLGMVVLALTGGVGLALYTWLWLFLPQERADGTADDDPELRRRLETGLARVREVGWPAVLGAAVVCVAVLVVVQALGADVDWQTAAPVGILVIGLGVAWMQADTAASPGRSRGTWLRIALGTALVLVSVLALAVDTAGPGTLWLGLLLAVALLAGLALVAAPFVLGLVARRERERTALAVQTERAEIAAHLHDSVLQSLALIQRRASDPETVARVARAQERELRSYLFDDHSQAPDALSEALRRVAGEVEDAHGRRIEVVAVGETEGEWLDPLVAASREAMANAARHAGHAQVYAEVLEDDQGAIEGVDVFVRDRGPGFDPDQLPADRHGVRESLRGRMERAGGTVRIRSSAGGTEVHLHLDAPAVARPEGGVRGTDPREEGA
ncbi:putative two-component system sensor kinase [Micrococcus lylae]|uniref:Putative two-component system sensor kinase n=1 Tax=Micrococcus lylae TaxID=1273 RepID=A0A1R4IVN8_9MICC|nr:ATP-binding protein [Micrococcus lylae]SJN23778.1 putative two-component system sensor kinase [Micrococcus lylae]